jgi:hypothetical protein
VANYAGAVEEAVRSKNKKRLEQYRARFDGTLDLYSF